MSTHLIAGMAVEVAGDGPPVICVHGLGGTSNTFTPQMQVLGGMRVVRPDLPCSGRTSNIENPTIAGFAAQIIRLADALDIKSAHFAAHSMGTIVCQHIAAARPELVRSMALFGVLIEPAEAARGALKQRAQTARAGGMPAIADAVSSAGTSASTKERNPAAVAFVRESILRQCPEGYARTCEALSEAQAADHWRISCPILIMTGEEDATAPPSVARALADADAGHDRCASASVLEQRAGRRSHQQFWTPTLRRVAAQPQPNCGSMWWRSA